MEQVAAERPFSQEQQFSQPQMWCNGTPDNGNVHLQPNPSQSQFPRESADRDVHGMPVSISGDKTNRDGVDYRPRCHDHLRGSCARGASCKFRHPETVEQDGFMFGRNERESLGPTAEPRNSQFDGEVEVGDSRRPFVREAKSRSPCRKFRRGRCERGATCPYLHHEFAKFHGENKDGYSIRSFGIEHRSRSPCRKFQSGKCERGANCPYLHDEFRKYDRPDPDWKSIQHHGFGPASMKPGLFEGNANNSLRASQGHDSADKANDARAMSFSREPRSQSPCRNFLRGICRFGASCRHWHDLSTARQPRIPVVSDRPNFFNRSKGLTSKEPRTRSPCRKFLKGSCRFGASCKNWHDPSAPQQPGISATLSRPSFVSGSLDLYSREHQINQHHNISTESFVREPSRSSPCRFFLKGSCNLGAYCGHLHPAIVYERTRYDNSIQQHQGQGATATRNYHCREGNVGREVMCRRMYSVNDGAVNGHNRAWPVEKQLARNRVNMDATSSSRSFDRQRHGFASDCGGDNLRPEVCLRFTRGRCDQGESCRYLHSFHEYASSTSRPSKRPCLKPGGSLMNGGLHQSVRTMMAQDHNTLNNDKIPLSEHQRTDRGLVCRDCSFDQEAHVLSTKKPAADDEIRMCNECHPGAANHMSDDQYPRIVANCVSLSSHANVGSNLISSRGQAEFVGHGMQVEQCPIGSPNPGAATFTKKNGLSAVNALNPSHPYKHDEKSVTNSTTIAVANGEAITGVEHMESISRTSSEELHISLPDIAMAVVEEDDKGESMIYLSKDGNEETDEMMHAVKIYSRKKRKRGTSSTQRCVEPCSEERAGSSQQMFVMGVSDTMTTCGAKTNVMEDDLVYELPVQWQGNKVLTNNVQNNVESSAANTADRTSLNCDRDNDNSLAALQSPDPAAPNYRRKLLVLDVNGLLADIVADFPDRSRPDTIVSGKGVFKRPFCDAFLQFCFERFDMGIWSSRNKKNVTRVVDFLMKNSKDKLLFCWDQSHCTQTGYKTVENQDKPLVLKELKKLWENQDKSLPWERGFYDQTNTVLLDDSPYKALRNPPCTAIFPFPYSFKHVRDNSLGPHGDLRLYLERLAEAENVQKFIQENPFGQRAITKTNLSWGFYSKIVGEYASQPEETANVSPDSS